MEVLEVLDQVGGAQEVLVLEEEDHQVEEEAVHQVVHGR
jgi:hypothetical protein